MMPDNPGARQAESAESARQDIEDAVHEVARRSRQEIPVRAFYGHLLDCAVAALAARGGAVWLYDVEGHLQLHCHNNPDATGIDTEKRDGPSRRGMIESAARDREARIVPPRSGSADGGAGNPTDQLLFLCPVRLDEEPIGLIEIAQRPELSVAAREGTLQFLRALSQLAADYHGNCRLREMRDRSKLWEQFQQFSERVHGSLDLAGTAYVLANEGRRLIGCDRLSVAVRRGSKYRIQAISGLDTFDRRSAAVRRLEELIRAVARTGEPLWDSGDRSALPPQIAEPLERYADESHAGTLAVLPLRSTAVSSHETGDRIDEIGHKNLGHDREMAGVIVVENFSAGAVDDATRHRIRAVCRQSARAMQNALEYQSIPFLPLLKLWRGTFRCLQPPRLPKTVSVLVVLAAALLALVLVPADFEISGRGELQPRIRRDVFATSDGVVRAVTVEQGDRVRSGQVLVELRNSERDFQRSRLLGEIQTTREELDTVSVSLRATNPVDSRGQAEYNELAAREKELKAKWAALQRQLEIVRSQTEELKVRSPLEGHVLTWDVHKRLDARPVRRGQVLMTVARLDGPWVVEVDVADEDIEHVLAARRKMGDDLNVDFVLAADPGRTFHGKVEEISRRTELNEHGEPTVRVTVAFDRGRVAARRPGASVVPRIHCGRRPVGYVWFRGLLEAVQRRLLF